MSFHTEDRSAISPDLLVAVVSTPLKQHAIGWKALNQERAA
jgi:hypothetical protein